MITLAINSVSEIRTEKKERKKKKLGGGRPVYRC
jgi:hypothetical protein